MVESPVTDDQPRGDVTVDEYGYDRAVPGAHPLVEVEAAGTGVEVRALQPDRFAGHRFPLRRLEVAVLLT